jgi:hypothetical protein
MLLNVATAGGRGGPPLRGDFGIRWAAVQQSSSSDVATRSAVECGVRGPGAESDSFIISGVSEYRRLRHEREASTAQAISITAAPTCADGHGGPPLRREFVSKSSYESMQSQRIERSAVSIGGRRWTSHPAKFEHIQTSHHWNREQRHPTIPFLCGTIDHLSCG